MRTRILLGLALFLGGFIVGHDTPDWGGKYVDTQFYPLDDMAELAVRLGSPLAYDRRGAVIWMYDFRDGIGDVGPSYTGTGSDVNLYADIYESPPFACTLQTGTTAAARAWIERRMALPLSKRVGYQASYRADAGGHIIYHNIYHYDGSLWWYAYLYLDLDNDLLRVYTAESGLVTVLDPMPDLVTGAYFAHIKLVVDLSTHKYVRAILDDQELDLSAYTIASTPSTAPPQIRIRSTAESSSGDLDLVLLDNLIITANEP